LLSLGFLLSYAHPKYLRVPHPSRFVLRVGSYDRSPPPLFSSLRPLCPLRHFSPSFLLFLSVLRDLCVTVLSSLEPKNLQPRTENCILPLEVTHALTSQTHPRSRTSTLLSLHRPRSILPLPRSPAKN